jgi:hypothetical protein
MVHQEFSEEGRKARFDRGKSTGSIGLRAIFRATIPTGASPAVPSKT